MIDNNGVFIINEDGDALSLQNILPSPINVEAEVMKKIWQEKVREQIDKLPPRECKVIRLRLGIDDGQSRTLEEVGQMFGVTRERIRQIEAKALRRLSHNKILKDLYNDRA